MKVLIVGGSGYVGSLMLPGLVDAGHSVRVLDPTPPADGAEWVCGSATDPDGLTTALEGMDAVIHAAMGRRGADGAPDVRSAFEVNVASVHMTFAAAAAANVKRGVLMSSISVFSNAPVPVTDRAVDESSVPDAVDTYGLTKRLAEVAAQAASVAHGMTISSLRIAWPTPDSFWPAWALPIFPEPAVIRCADGTPIPALAASDLSAAVVAALRRDGGGFEVFHIVGEDGSGRCWSTAKAREQLGWQALRR